MGSSDREVVSLRNDQPGTIFGNIQFVIFVAGTVLCIRARDWMREYHFPDTYLDWRAEEDWLARSGALVYNALVFFSRHLGRWF